MIGYKYLTGSLSHEVLANTMPFYCCWLVDKVDESIPDEGSIGFGWALYSARMAQLLPDTEVWTN